MTEIPLRLAATILLLRDAPDMEVLMVRRHDAIEFASGALVFPGGTTVPGDRAEGWATRADGGFTGDELALRVAAVREAFEESGILLARRSDSRGRDAPLVGAEMADALAPLRGPVDRGEADFLDLVAEHDLVLALDRLVHFGHWITPPVAPKRFDTHFYLAATPSGQTARQDGHETTEAIWITPEAALAAEEEGRATIIFPTRLNIRRLALAGSTGEALRRFTGQEVPTILPEVIRDEAGTAFLRIPEVEGYGQTIEPVAKVQRTMKPRRPAPD